MKSINLQHRSRSGVGLMVAGLALAMVGIFELFDAAGPGFAADVLSRRGGNPENEFVVVGNCNTINGYTICTTQGANCQACELGHQSNWTSWTGSGTGPGWDPEFVSCGRVYNGLCNGTNECIVVLFHEITCQANRGLPKNQSIDP